MRQKNFFLNYMDIECNTTKSKIRENTDTELLFKIGHQWGVSRQRNNIALSIL